MDNMEKIVINFLESFYSDILENECQQFCKESHTYIDKRVNRQLKTKYGTLILKKPTVRYFAKNLNYSLFKKYERRCQELLDFEEKIYSSRIYKKDIKKVLGLSNIAESRRKQLIKKYVTMYNQYIAKKKQQYDIIKIDATYFDFGYTVYFIFGIKDKNIKILYYHVDIGDESANGWDKVVNYIQDNKNFGAIILISDLKNTLKIRLSKLKGILIQNCIWHRIYSYIRRMSLSPQDKKNIFHQWYNYFLCCDYEKSSSYFDNFKPNDFTKSYYGDKKKKDVSIMKNFYFEDNFSYLGLPLDIQEKYKVKNVIQNMDIEAYISQIKHYMKKFPFYRSVEELQGKLFICLSNLGYLEN